MSDPPRNRTAVLVPGHHPTLRSIPACQIQPALPKNYGLLRRRQGAKTWHQDLLTAFFLQKKDPVIGRLRKKVRIWARKKRRKRSWLSSLRHPHIPFNGSIQEAIQQSLVPTNCKALPLSWNLRPPASIDLWEDTTFAVLNGRAARAGWVN